MYSNFEAVVAPKLQMRPLFDLQEIATMQGIEGNDTYARMLLSSYYVPKQAKLYALSCGRSKVGPNSTPKRKK
jgi:hypothetical protein